MSCGFPASSSSLSQWASQSTDLHGHSFSLLVLSEHLPWSVDATVKKQAKMMKKALEKNRKERGIVSVFRDGVEVGCNF